MRYFKPHVIVNRLAVDACFPTDSSLLDTLVSTASCWHNHLARFDAGQLSSVDHIDVIGRVIAAPSANVKASAAVAHADGHSDQLGLRKIETENNVQL